MILVSLGTQDRSFKRLLQAVEKQILLGNIKEKVIVQAGETHYESDCMEIFSLIPSEEFSKLLKECRVLITHGGVGTIIEGLKHHKKIIAAARLVSYGEHQNNHQQQIISEFSKRHFLLELEDFDQLDQVLIDVKSFEPATFESNNSAFISLLDTYILENLKNSKGDFIRLFMIYLFYGVLVLFLESCFLFGFSKFSISPFFSICWFQLFLIGFRMILYRHFFPEKSLCWKEELFFLLLLAIQVLLVFFFPSFFQTTFIWKSLGMSFLSIWLSFLFATYFLKQE